DAPGANRHREYTQTRRFPEWRADQTPRLPQPGAVPLHPLATGVRLRRDESRFFLHLVGAASQAEVCTDLVQIAKTDLDAESFLEGCLHYTAWSAGRRVAVGFPARPARPFAAWQGARVFHPRKQLSHGSAPGAAAD